MRSLLSTPASALALMTAACVDAGAPQEIVGRIDAGSFPEEVSAVRAIGTGASVDAAIHADGTFVLSVPGGDRFRIELVSDARATSLVFPRQTGVIHTTFYVEAGRARFDLGTVRYVPDPTTRTFSFDGIACVDGLTADGSICVDDTGAGGGGDTGAGGGGDTGAGGGGDTGAGGGGDTGAGGGQDQPHSCGVAQPAPEGGSSHDTAVADRNLPAEIGCSGGDGDTGTGGGQDPGPGTGGGDTGTGGGGDTGSGGGQDPGPGGVCSDASPCL